MQYYHDPYLLLRNNSHRNREILSLVGLSIPAKSFDCESLSRFHFRYKMSDLEVHECDWWFTKRTLRSHITVTFHENMRSYCTVNISLQKVNCTSNSYSHHNPRLEFFYFICLVLVFNCGDITVMACFDQRNFAKTHCPAAASPNP